MPIKSKNPHRPKYVTLPYPAAFYRQALRDNSGLDANTIPSFDQNKIQAVLDNPNALIDIVRVNLQFGAKGNRIAFTDTHTTAVIEAVKQAAIQEKFDITEAEIKAILAFESSTVDAISQGGYVKTATWAYTFLYQSILQLNASSDSKSDSIQIYRDGDKLILVNDYSVNRFRNHENAGGFDLVVKHETFVLEENNQRFQLTTKDNFDDYLMEEKFFQKVVVPKVRTYLEENPFLINHEIAAAAPSAVEALTQQAYMVMAAITPLLVNSKICKAYCQMISQQAPALQEKAIQYITSCFSLDKSLQKKLYANADIKKLFQQAAQFKSEEPSSPTVTSTPPSTPMSKDNELSPELKHNELSSATQPSNDAVKSDQFEKAIPDIGLDDEAHPDLPPLNYDVKDVLKPSRALSLALNKLQILLKSNEHTIPPAQREAALEVSAAVEALSAKQRAKHYPLLTHIIENTTAVLGNPSAHLNVLEQYRADTAAVAKKNWRRVAIAMTAVFVGALVIAAATFAAVASFGATSLLSTWGIAVSASMMAKAISITSGALGLGLFAGGVAHSQPPLKHLSTAAHRFFKTAFETPISTATLGEIDTSMAVKPRQAK